MMQVQEPQLGSAQPLSTRTAWSMIDPTEGPGWMYVVPLCVWADIKSVTEVPPPVLPSYEKSSGHNPDECLAGKR